MNVRSNIDHLDAAIDHEISAADLSADREIKRGCLQQIARLHFSREMRDDHETRQALEIAFHVSAAAMRGRPTRFGIHIVRHPNRDMMIRGALDTLRAHPRLDEEGTFAGLRVAETMLRHANISDISKA